MSKIRCLKYISLFIVFIKLIKSLHWYNDYDHKNNEWNSNTYEHIHQVNVTEHQYNEDLQ